MTERNRELGSIAGTNVRHGDKWWRVSTINRASSSVYCPESIYAETIVWEWDPETKANVRLVHSDSGAAGSINVHLDCVASIWERGAFWESEGDE